MLGHQVTDGSVFGRLSEGGIAHITSAITVGIHLVRIVGSWTNIFFAEHPITVRIGMPIGAQARDVQVQLQTLVTRVHKTQLAHTLTVLHSLVGTTLATTTVGRLHLIRPTLGARRILVIDNIVIKEVDACDQ